MSRSLLIGTEWVRRVVENEVAYSHVSSSPTSPLNTLSNTVLALSRTLSIGSLTSGDQKASSSVSDGSISNSGCLAAICERVDRRSQVCTPDSSRRFCGQANELEIQRWRWSRYKMQHTSNTSTFFEKASNVPSNVSAQVSIARVRGDVYRLSGARSPPLEHSVIHSWWTAWAWA